MNETTSDCKQPGTSARKDREGTLRRLGRGLRLVIGVYAWSAKSGWLELWSSNAENSYYNLLVQGFRAGQLNLKTRGAVRTGATGRPLRSGGQQSYLVGSTIRCST